MTTPRKGAFHAPIRLALAAMLAMPAALAAQLGSYNPRPGPQGTYAIRGGHIYPVSGPEIANGTVVISGGKITAVGATVTVPNGATIIDASGMSVYPGMMETSNSVGLAEITEGANATVDNSEVGRLNANMHAFWGFDPHSAYIGTTRFVGITHIVTAPTGGLISGSAALMNLAGDTPPQMAVVPSVAMVVQLPGGGRGGRGGGGGGAAAPATAAAASAPLDSIKNVLRDAGAYFNGMAAYAKDKTLPRPKHDLVLDALLPVINGTMPVMIPAESQTQIREAVAFAEEMKIKPIIVGGRDAYRMTDYLKQHDVPVIVTNVMSLPGGADDPYDVNYSAPGKLAAAGVRFAIASGEPNPDIRNLPFVAGMAASFGLSHEDALKSVTLWPAQIFGVGDKLGSIEVGKMANIVVTDGDLLEARTNTKYLFIDGRPVPLDNKHTDLYNMFKDRP
jgi:imidazolonepropionase-like amidohydrolase